MFYVFNKNECSFPPIDEPFLYNLLYSVYDYFYHLHSSLPPYDFPFLYNFVLITYFPFKSSSCFI